LKFANPDAHAGRLPGRDCHGQCSPGRTVRRIDPQRPLALLLLRQPQPPLIDGSAMRVPRETNLRRAIRLGSLCPSRIDRQEAPFAAAFHDLS
jgi:hypothetical protein